MYKRALEGCHGFESTSYGTCPTSVVWATDEGSIDQMGTLTVSPIRLVCWDEFSCLIYNKD